MIKRIKLILNLTLLPLHYIMAGLKPAVMSISAICLISTVSGTAWGNVDLDYLLRIEDPGTGTATVRLTIGNLVSDSFTLEEYGFHGLNVNVLSLSDYILS